ncbi:MAG TPA: hypothetical protein DCO79_11440 [Spirochaeta sp.]|nr:hypothetical protein [Spirochaeta sp.]
MTESEYERYSTLAELAELYYLKGMQQAEIAQKMNISRSLVSRMISEAQQKGIVSISVNHFFRRSEELEKRIKKQWGVEAAVLCLPPRLNADERKRQLGRFAADLIYDVLSAGSIAGFTFGTSLKETVESLLMKPPKNIIAVQLTGSLGASEAAFDSHELVHKLSLSWNCSSVFLHAPLIVNSEEIRRQLYKSRSNRLNAETCRKLDTVVVGMSSFDSRNSSALYTGGHVSAGDMSDMRKAGIIGDLGSFSLDKNGNLVEVDSLTRMMALSDTEWKNIDNRMGIAFGNNKIDIIRASLKGGWLTNFVTDESSAERILN